MHQIQTRLQPSSALSTTLHTIHFCHTNSSSFRSPLGHNNKKYTKLIAATLKSLTREHITSDGPTIFVHRHSVQITKSLLSIKRRRRDIEYPTSKFVVIAFITASSPPSSTRSGKNTPRCSSTHQLNSSASSHHTLYNDTMHSSCEI